MKDLEGNLEKNEYNRYEKQIRNVVMSAQEGSTIGEIAKTLKISRNELLFQFNKKPSLREFYEEMHHERYRKVKEAIIIARKDVFKAEIARNLGISRHGFDDYLRHHP